MEQYSVRMSRWVYETIHDAIGNRKWWRDVIINNTVRPPATELEFWMEKQQKLVKKKGGN
jgi:hypothetical protein